MRCVWCSYPTTIIIGDFWNTEPDTLWLTAGNSITNHSNVTKSACPESWTTGHQHRVYLGLIDLIAFFWLLLENRLFPGTSFNELLLIQGSKCSLADFEHLQKNTKCNKIDFLHSFCHFTLIGRGEALLGLLFWYILTWHFDRFWHDTLTDADVCQLSTHLPLTLILMVISTGLFYVNGGSKMQGWQSWNLKRKICLYSNFVVQIIIVMFIKPGSLLESAFGVS